MTDDDKSDDKSVYLPFNIDNILRKSPEHSDDGHGVDDDAHKRAPHTLQQYPGRETTNTLLQ